MREKGKKQTDNGDQQNIKVSLKPTLKYIIIIYYNAARRKRH